RLADEEKRLAGVATEEAEAAKQAYAADLRVALEDWQATVHAQSSLGALDGQIAEAETATRAVEGDLNAAAEDEAAAVQRAGVLTTRSVSGLVASVIVAGVAVAFRVPVLL